MRKAVLVLVLLAAAAGHTAAQVGSPNWSSFVAADICGITITSPDSINYTVCLQPGATLNTLSIDRILGFYLVGDPQGTQIQALDFSPPSGWNFLFGSAQPGDFAGWEAQPDSGANDIEPGECQSFSLDAFRMANGGVIPGFHLRYSYGDGTGEGYFKGVPCPPPAIPEPTSLVLGVLGLSASGALLQLRRRLID